MCLYACYQLGLKKEHDSQMFKWTVHSAKQLTALDFTFIGVIAHSLVAAAAD